MRSMIQLLMTIAVPVCALEHCAPASAQESRPAADTSAAAAKAEKSKSDILYAPVPFSNPETGPGIAAGGVAFYNPNGEPNQWKTGGGAVFASRGSKGIAAFHSMSWGHDLFRLSASLGYFDEAQNYYGTGAEAGDRDDSLRLQDQYLKAKLRILRRVSPANFVGFQYMLNTHSAAPDEEDESVTTPPPAEERDSTLSMIGPVLVHDTRDDHSQPHAGVYASVAWLFGFGFIGDSFSHDKLAIAGSVYTTLSPRAVLAARASFCSASGEAAYYALCEFGSGNDLRGYPAGRYRDRASWALQVELRRAIAKRWGVTGFVGIGGIAPSVGHLFSDSKLLPAVGAGVRYRPFRDNSVQLRIDFAIGDDANGLYFGIGEAF